MKKKEVV